MEHKLIYKIAWTFSNGNVQAFEDLKSEATLAYLEAEKTFKPELGIKFTTFAYKCMRNKLIDYTKKENQYFPTDEFPDIGYTTTPFFEILDSLSDKAKFVAEFILKNLGNYNECTAWEARGQIRKDLEKLGWNNYQRRQVIKELKKAFG